MSLQQFLEANQAFIAQGKLQGMSANLACNGMPINTFPCKALVIVTCIDTRLVQFLEPALGLVRGEATIIKNAGNIVGGPDSDIIRSLVVAVFAQHCREILIIGHTDCGMAKINIQSLSDNMLASGIEEIHLDLQTLGAWLGGFTDEAENVVQSVFMARSAAKIPSNIPIHGLLMDIHSGEIKHLVTM